MTDLQLLLVPADEGAEAKTECRADVAEFNEVDPSLATLVLTDEGLRTPEKPGQVGLTQPRSSALPAQQVHKHEMLVRVDRLGERGHKCPFRNPTVDIQSWDTFPHVAEHMIHMETPPVELGRTDVKFVVVIDGVKRGELHVSQGGLDWWPRSARSKRLRRTWAQLEAFFDE